METVDVIMWGMDWIGSDETDVIMRDGDGGSGRYNVEPVARQEAMKGDIIMRSYSERGGHYNVGHLPGWK